MKTDRFSCSREQEDYQKNPRKPTQFKAIWISDVHLGTPESHAERLLELLQLTESETLYLVGDIVDRLELKRHRYWEQSDAKVVEAIVEKASQGTRVVFVPCTRGAPIRKFVGQYLKGIPIQDELVHVTAQGKRMLVLHGDRFDRAANNALWLRYCGTHLAPTVQRLLQAVDNWRERIGLTDRSLPGWQDIEPVDAVYLRSFAQALTSEAKQKGLDGVICSHVHKPEIREISGILYCNDGDWAAHQSAMVEDLSGALRLVTWQDIILQSDRAALCEDLAASESQALLVGNARRIPTGLSAQPV